MEQTKLIIILVTAISSLVGAIVFLAKKGRNKEESKDEKITLEEAMKIAQLETEMKYVKRELEEYKQDSKKNFTTVFGKIDDLKDLLINKLNN